ncbi:hypothetical protein BG004_004109, partial [Podila humilis]
PLTMKFTYLVAALSLVAAVMAAPALQAEAAEVAQEWCYCEPAFEHAKPIKSPDCCY